MFLGEPPASEAAEAAYAKDRESAGYVDNLTRLWCWRPDVHASFVEFRASLMTTSALTDRERAVLVTATASARGDSYCSLAWGPRLAELSDDETAAQILSGKPAPALSERESCSSRLGAPGGAGSQCDDERRCCPSA